MNISAPLICVYIIAYIRIIRICVGFAPIRKEQSAHNLTFDAACEFAAKRRESINYEKV